MQNISPISNGEPGAITRAKLNTLIARSNAVDGNFRFKANNTLQLRETAPVPGWRTMWLVNGVLQFGELETD